MFGFLEWVEIGPYGIQIDNQFLFAEKRGYNYYYTINQRELKLTSKEELRKIYWEFLKPTMKKFPCDEKISFFTDLNQFLLYRLL